MWKCALFGHAPVDRAAVWFDGLDYRASCARCDAPMIQDFTLGVWRTFGATDFDLRRDARPGAG